MHLRGFFSTCDGVEKKIFDNVAFFTYLALPGGGIVIHFTIYIFLILDVLQTKNGNDWSFSFQEGVKIVK